MEKHVNSIVNLVGTNDLSVLVSPVGSGKTTLLPKLFSDHNAIVYCIQPTEYAVTNIYDYLSKKHGKLIGVELKNKKILHEKNKIIYCTCDIVLDKFLKKDFTFCNIIMIDDSHYYSLDYEFLIYLWIYYYSKIDLPKLFMSLSMDDIPYIPVDVSNSIYKIEDNKERLKIYHERNYKFSEKDKLIEDMAEEIIRLDKEKKVDDYSTWLAYVWDIKYANKLLDLLKNEKFDVTLFRENSKIYNQKNKRIVIIMIDMNTSVTLNHVDGIIDSMLEIMLFKKLTGGDKKVFKNISRSTAIQRDGRTNRTKKGFCYRMCTEEFYRMLSKYTPSEMDRVDLTNLFITLYKFNLDPSDIFGLKLERQVIDYYSSLIEKYNLTNNKFIQDINGLDVLNKLFLYEWNKTKNSFFSGIVVASILNLKQPLCYYKNKQKKNYFDKHFKHLGTNILEIYCNIYIEFLKVFNGGKYNIDYLKKFCIEKSYKFNTVKKFIDMIKTIYIYFKTKNYSVKIQLFNVSEVVENALSILKTIYSNNICVKNKMNYVNKNKTVFSLNIYEHFSPEKPAENIIILHSKTITDDENRNIGKNTIMYYINIK